MLRFWHISGEELASIPVDEMNDVQSLKQRLVSHCNYSRFRQRFLHDGVVLGDDAKLNLPIDVQVVFLPYTDTSEDDAISFAESAQYGHRDLEERLARPQNPNLRNRWGESPLGLACARGSANAARLLLEAFANINMYFNMGTARKTPLGAAVLLDSAAVATELVPLLLQSRANPNLANYYMDEYVQVGLAYKTWLDHYYLDDEDCKSETPLGMTCRYGNVQIASLLLKASASTEEGIVTRQEYLLRARAKLSPLAVACKHGHLNVVRLLLQAGADRDGTDPRPDLRWRRSLSPLCAAAVEGHVEVARLLIEAGSDKHKTDGFDEAPFDIAYSKKHYEMMQLIAGTESSLIYAFIRRGWLPKT